jgi:hypothetical protein
MFSTAISGCISTTDSGQQDTVQSLTVITAYSYGVKAEYWHKWNLIPHTAQKNENPSAAKLSDGHRHLS